MTDERSPVMASALSCSIMLTLDTPRLRLRRFESADAAVLSEILDDPEVARWLFIGTPPRGVGAAWRNIALLVGHWQLRGYGQWAVVEKATGALVGRAGLWYPEGWPGIEVGWLIRRSRWGNGFATEAARAALDWAWKTLDVDRIISVIQPENARSIRVAEKIGERFERADVVNDLFVHIYGIDRPARLKR